MKRVICARTFPGSARGVALSLVFLGLTGLTVAEKAPKTPEPSWSQEIIELPKFVVTDSRALPPPESWRYAKLPGFEILSSASDRATQRLIRDFFLFQQALGVVWPLPEANTPVLLVLCGHGGQFDTLIPPAAEGASDMARASAFLKGRGRDAIIVDVDTPFVTVRPAGGGISGGENDTEVSVEPNKQLYREYVRFVLSKAQPRLPAWFEEGMSQIVMAMKFDRTFIEFGKIERGNTVSAQAGARSALNQMAMDAGMEPDAPNMPGAPSEDRDFNNALAHRALLPLDRFFAVGHDAAEAKNPLGNNRWAKQAYAFVHMGLFGERLRWQKPFSEFLVRSTREPVTEAMFKQCFGMSYKSMAVQLRGYIEFTDYQSKEYRIKNGELPTADKLALRDATQSEIGRIKGDVLTMAARPDAARNEYIAPYIRGERDPDLLAALGLAEHKIGKDDRARKFLAAAVAGKTIDADAYLQLARFRLADALAAPSGPNRHLSAEQTASVTSLLQTSRSLQPSNAALYEVFAEVLSNSATRPTAPEIGPLIDGVKRHPGNLKLVYTAAVLCADAGLNEAAQSLIEHGLKLAAAGPARDAFASLQKSVPPPSPPVQPTK